MSKPGLDSNLSPAEAVHMTTNAVYHMVLKLETSRAACLTLHRMLELSESFTNTLHLKDLEFIINQLDACIAAIKKT